MSRAAFSHAARVTGQARPATAGLITAVAAVWLAGCAASPQPAAPDADPTTDPVAIEAAAADEALRYPEWQTVAPGENARYNQRTSLVQRGHRVYGKYCVGCHGVYGDGRGPASARLLTRPRDFTSGIFKFRSTDSGSLPLDADLDRVITRGLAQVSMPAFPLMPEHDKVAVIAYIKTFYPRWDEQKGQRRVVHVPPAPDDLATAMRRRRGRVVYLQIGCWKCHGTDGRGQGATQTAYVDAWGEPQRPFDFTRGALKGGDAPEDIYRTFHTGLRSIMPSFGGDTLAAVSADAAAVVAEAVGAEEAARLAPVLAQFPAGATAIYVDLSDAERLRLAERNSWDLVAYIQSLRTRTTTAAAVLGVDPAAAGSGD